MGREYIYFIEEDHGKDISSIGEEGTIHNQESDEITIIQFSYTLIQPKKQDIMC
jgi:hypothetical protein